MTGDELTLALGYVAFFCFLVTFAGSVCWALDRWEAVRHREKVQRWNDLQRRMEAERRHGR